MRLGFVGPERVAQLEPLRVIGAARRLQLHLAKRCALRARALAASTSRVRGAAFVCRACNSLCDVAAISLIAALKAAALASEGLLNPLTLRTNCSAAASTSCSVAGGWKLKSGRILRHIVDSAVLIRARRASSPPW